MGGFGHGCVAIAGAVLAAIAAGPAHAQLRVVTYNTLSTGSNVEIRPRGSIGTVFEGLAAQNRPGFAGPLDIVLLQEQDNVATSTAAFRDLLNTIFDTDVYVSGTRNGQSAGGGRPGVVYNTATLQLIAETSVNTTSGTGAARATLRYQFRPVGYDAAADFYVYNSHFKASDTATDRERRGVEAAQVRANADALGSGVLAIYAGDMNLYRATEPAFVTLTGTGPGQAFDPLDRVGTWSGGSSFKDVHTQSPVTSAEFGGQVTGGMDDRFDFQLVTGGLLDERGLDYIPGSYWAFGNTGSHTFDGDLSSGTSAAGLRQYLPGYSEAQAGDVISAIMASSDHLPVVADYRLPARLAVAAPVLSGTVLKNATLSGTFTVTNAAPARFAAGADVLDYTIAAGGGLTASGSGSLAALSAATAHTFTVATAAAGTLSGTLSVATSSPQAAAGPFTQAYAVQVLDTAQVQRVAAGPATAFAGTFTFGSDGNVASFPYNGTAIPDGGVGNLEKVGVNTSSSSDNFRATLWPTGATDGADTFNGAVDLGKYFEFTLTADPGSVLEMTSLTFGVGRSATGPRQWQWRSSVDGFAAAIESYSAVNGGLGLSGGVLTNPDANSSWTGNVLDLSAAAFQGLEEITLRLYGFNAESSAGTGGLQGPLSFAGKVAAATGSVPAEIAPGGVIMLANSAAEGGTQRAAAAIATRTVTGDAGWSVSGLGQGSVVAAAASLSGTAAFDTTGRLNGTYTATFTLGMEHADQSLPGAAAGDVGTLSWDLATTVAGRTGSGTAGLAAGRSYAGLGIESAVGQGTRAGLLGGTTSTDRTVSMEFTVDPAGDGFASDVLSLLGTSGDVVVLSLTYDLATAASLGGEVFLGWLDTRSGSLTNGEWINAVLGNSANLMSLDTAYAGSWAAFAESFAIASPTQALGAWGYDATTTTAWAVIDHNSQFAVLAVPEPAAALLALIGLCACGGRCFRHRQCGQADGNT